MRRAVFLLPLIGLVAACDTDASACGDGAGRMAPHTVVISKLRFSTPVEGATEGFDLDDRVSDTTDDRSCNRVDTTDSAGRPGIDNVLASLFLTVQSLVGNAIDGLIQMAINDGTLLVMFRLEGVDDLENDPCVQISILKGTGPTTPQLATTGFLAPSQTFELDEATPVTTGVGYIEDGVLHAGPFDAVIPLKFFQVFVNMRLHGAYVRAELTEDGGLVNGVLGGGIEVDQIVDVVKQAAENDGTAQSLVNITPILLRNIADLDNTGERCAQASAALVFEAEKAFLVGDSLTRTNDR